MPFSDLVHDDGFRTGLVLGGVAALLVLIAVVSARWAGWRRAEPLPAAGIAFAAAALLSLSDLERGAGVSDRFVVGVVLLVLAPLLAKLGGFRRSLLTSGLCAVPGAAVVASAASLENDVGWVPPVVFVSIVVASILVVDFDGANARAGLGPVLFAIALLAMYTAVPDTEEAAAVAGAALPIALLGAPFPVAALGAAGAPAAVGIIVVGRGRRGRPDPARSSVRSRASGCCSSSQWSADCVPGSRPRHPRRPLSIRAVLIVALDLGLVAGTSRVAGLETSGGIAARSRCSCSPSPESSWRSCSGRGPTPTTPQLLLLMRPTLRRCPARSRSLSSASQASLTTPISKRCMQCCRALDPIASRRGERALEAESESLRSRGGTTTPLSPSITTSLTAPTSVATTGSPRARPRSPTPASLR